MQTGAVTERGRQLLYNKHHDDTFKDIKKTGINEIRLKGGS
jgi:hypothetical protein